MRGENEIQIWGRRKGRQKNKIIESEAK